MSSKQWVSMFYAQLKKTIQKTFKKVIEMIIVECLKWKKRIAGITHCTIDTKLWPCVRLMCMQIYQDLSGFF